MLKALRLAKFVANRQGRFMARHLKGYEVLGGLLIGGLAIAWLANRDSTANADSSNPATQVAKPVPQQLTIRSGAVICFSREDWESFKSAAVDNHLTQLRLLFDAGKCQQIASAMVTKYLDPVAGNAALVQTPGGRGAIVFLKDTQ